MQAGCGRFNARVFSRPLPLRRPAVLLIHDLGLCSDQWTSLAQRLVRSFDVYAPDLPAHGASAPTSHKLGAKGYALWLADWMRLIGLKRASIVARASACPIAVELALADVKLVDRLVLISPRSDRRHPRGMWHRLFAPSQSLTERLALLKVPALFVSGDWDPTVREGSIEAIAEMRPLPTVAVAAAGELAGTQRLQLLDVMEPFLFDGSGAVQAHSMGREYASAPQP
jgi:pimeloyl-ACP methyl ester carboxylesterase